MTSDAAPRRYSDFFECGNPRSGFHFTLSVFVAFLISNNSIFLFGYFPSRNESLLARLSERIVSFEVEQVLIAATSALALYWISLNLKEAWQIGLLFGAADGVANALVPMIVNLLRPTADPWIPLLDWRSTIMNVIWGLFLITSVAGAIRLGGRRPIVLLAAGICSWCAYGFCWRFLFEARIHAGVSYLRYGMNGLLFGAALSVALYALEMNQTTVEPSDKARLERIRKGRFLTTIGAASMVSYLLFVVGEKVSPRSMRLFEIVLYLAALLLSILGVVTLLILVHHMWKAIQDYRARTSPGRAVGLLFVPLYNFYWLFQVYAGFAKDYNRYLSRHSIGKSARLPVELFTFYCVLALASLIPTIGVLFSALNLFVLLAVVARICDAVNALPASSHELPPPLPSALSTAT